MHVFCGALLAPFQPAKETLFIPSSDKNAVRGALFTNTHCVEETVQRGMWSPYTYTWTCAYAIEIGRPCCFLKGDNREQSSLPKINVLLFLLRTSEQLYVYMF